MVRSIDVGDGAGTYMAARFVLDKVVCETISPLSGLARTRQLCALESTSSGGTTKV